MTSVGIRRARLYEVAIPLREPFRISGGALEVRRSLVVELQDEDGRVGYGESAPFERPFYSAETIASARELLQSLLLPRMVGRSFSGPAEVQQVLSADVRGNPMARAGPETAWWDLDAVHAGTCLAERVANRLRQLGVEENWCRRTSHIECGMALGIPRDESLDVLRAEVEHAIERGYHRIKLKVMPGWDVEPVTMTCEIVRSRGAHVSVTVDANGAYSWPEHEAPLRELDACGLAFLEQPLAPDALWDTRVLAEHLETPVCLDESLTSDDVARHELAMDGPKIWNLKVQRVGGLEAACRIYARAVRSRVRVWAGTMPETGLGAQAVLALAGHVGFSFPSDLEPSDRWYGDGADLIELTMDARGRMPVPSTRQVPRVAGRGRLVAEV